MSDQWKQCPRCGTPAALHAPQCLQCGRVYQSTAPQPVYPSPLAAPPRRGIPVWLIVLIIVVALCGLPVLGLTWIWNRAA